MANYVYGVTAQRKDSNDVITAIEVRTISPTATGPAIEWTKSDGVSTIDKGYKMCTMLRNPNTGGWTIQANINVVTDSYGNKFLRTDANNTPKDNLENLPPF